MYLLYLVDNCFTISCWFLSYINMNQSQVPSSHHGNFLSQFQDDAFTCWPWDAGYINFRDSFPCGSWALIFVVMTVQDREGLAWVILTFQGVRLDEWELLQRMASKLTAGLLHPLYSSDRKGQEGRANKQTTSRCQVTICQMLPVHINLYNHQGPKRWCDQGHLFTTSSREVKTLLKAAQRVSVCQ